MKFKNHNNISHVNILSKMKKISFSIMKKIHDSVNGVKEIDRIMIDIKGKDSIVTIFLRLSGLLCKLVLIENKIEDHKQKQSQSNGDMSCVDDITDSDVKLIESFLSSYRNKSDGGEK